MRDRISDLIVDKEAAKAVEAEELRESEARLEFDQLVGLIMEDLEGIYNEVMQMTVLEGTPSDEILGQLEHITQKMGDADKIVYDM